ncbi:MAG: hypothetical protein ACRC63_02970, partial [Metamycoplasmataceae bacterium]
VQVDYTHLELTNDVIHSFNFLKSLFNGIEEDDLDNLEISLENEIHSHTITLTAKDDFYFLVNGEKTKTIVSHPFKTLGININITKINNPTITRNDIESENYKTLETLEKLFNGINQSILDNISVEISNEANIRIILIANEGYRINGANEYSSDGFIISIILNITPKLQVPNNITHVDLENDGFKTLSVLNKLFDGIETKDLEFMDITVPNRQPNGDFWPYEYYEIVIKPKEGYIFLDNSGTNINELKSVRFRTSEVIFDIETLSNPIIDNADITNDNYRTLDVLEKLFIGEKDLTENNLNDMEIILNEPTIQGDNYYTITISFIKAGFRFSNGLSSLESEGFILRTILNVTSKQNLLSTPNHLELLDIRNPYYEDHDQKLEILRRLFNGLKIDDIYNILEIITLDEPTPGLNKQTVTLVANSEYAFILDGKEVDRISSIEFITSPVILKIEPTYQSSLN